MHDTPIFFAPLEGITDSIFRRKHFERFGGIARYYIPFISPTKHLSFTSREQRAVSPVENEGMPVVPQVLTNDGEHFVATARLLYEAGYDEVDLNLGCPSGTVTAKRKGAGLLREPDDLRRFLDKVFEGAPPCGISIKTRIGFESVEEWPKLWSIFRQYPLSMLIVHPRTRREFYKGHAHRELFGLCSDAPFPCVYNGDLVSIADFEDTLERCPTTGALMVGRGLVTNPALARRWNGGAALGREELRAFHDELLDEYRTKWPPKAVLGHMQEIMWYMLCCFDEEKKARKAIRKAQDVKGYTEAIDRLFETCPFRDEPCFHFGDE